MVEPATVGAALAAAKHAVSLVKNLHSWVKETGKSEVIGQFLDLQSAMLDLQEKQHELIDRVRELDEENRTLRSNKALREKMKYNGRAYEVMGAGEANGEYCQVCLDRDAKFIRLKIYERASGGTAGYLCQVCNSRF